jgi:hypothetical protein
MIALNGQMGELRMTLQITRKDTGKVEQVELVGYLDEDKLKELQNAGTADRNASDDFGS